MVQWDRADRAQGYHVRWGVHRDKLYLSWLIYDEMHLDLPRFNKGVTYFVCVDCFNENGIIRGKTIAVEG